MKTVESIKCITTLDIPPEKVLMSAIEAGVEDLMVIGYLDGELYVASTTSNAPELLFMMERARNRLMKLVVGDESER